MLQYTKTAPAYVCLINDIARLDFKARDMFQNVYLNPILKLYHQTLLFLPLFFMGLFFL